MLLLRSARARRFRFSSGDGAATAREHEGDARSDDLALGRERVGRGAGVQIRGAGVDSSLAGEVTAPTDRARIIRP